MHAITLDAGTLRFRDDYPLPTPGEQESLVRVIQAGVCETDLQLARGYMGFSGVPGHEFVGIAETGGHAGRRVVGEINCSCGQCATCQAGRPTHCPHRTVVGIDRHDGAFAQWLAIPESNLHAVPESVSDDQAVFVEPLAAAFQITDQVDITKSDRVAVIGDGRLGFLSAQVLSLHSEHVTVFGKHQHKLARFADKGQSVATVAAPDPADLPHHAFDVVVDCTGSTTGLGMAVQLVRPRGTVVLKTTVAGTHELSLAAIVIDEINLVGSRCGPFDKAMDALQTGVIDVDGLITNRFRLDQVEQAFHSATQPNSFKVVFDIGSDPQ
ncbi:alcohol dehydrogenase catalytic domain-containing protein [Roseiconus nitratireducens]|uniref:Alcohol dehydrogenase catalytic domain-containing protein n=1 Tax=Roseiconus nitratireducens TaxID=2605748 RepID=A0A5M6DH58_9BACT|nr:alcohol dehydrogenase catalytic domain-containing protein [Roseiconus nitratireducens]KAA5545539.1 alcohol dehydrogenase catalytic domain-containing protein [Roseiconus nitratireducens]